MFNQEYNKTAIAAASTIKNLFPQINAKIAIILGSGWNEVANMVSNPKSVSYNSLSGFPLPSVEGHSANLIYGKIANQEVLVLTGRKHTYETDEPTGMISPILTLKELGVEILIQTNAAGSLSLDMPAGSIMLISDHINFSQKSPLTGMLGSERFCNMVNAYDHNLREQAKTTASSLNEKIYEGVYVWFCGPQFETPAEIRMFQKIGGEAVGMSTVPETIIARYLGIKVLAFSLLTNMAAGLSTEVLSHSHTLSQAAQSTTRAGNLLIKTVEGLKL